MYMTEAPRVMHFSAFIDTVDGYCSRWRLRTNVSKSAVLVFSFASGEWKWGEHMLPTMHIWELTLLAMELGIVMYKMCVHGREKLNQLHNVLRY